MSIRTTSAAPYNCDKTFWDDIRAPYGTLAPGGAPPDIISFGPSGSVRCYGFDGGATLESIEGAIQFPHSYKEGSNIRPHVHWAPTTTGLGDVVWQLDYYWLNFGDVASGAPTTIVASATPAQGAPMGTAWKHMINAFSELNGTGKHISSMIIFRLFRDPTHVLDTYTGDAAFLEFDIHYQIDGTGSFGEYTK